MKLFVPYGGSGKPLMQTRKLTVAPQAFPLSFASSLEIYQISISKAKRKRLNYMSLFFYNCLFLNIFVYDFDYKDTNYFENQEKFFIQAARMDINLIFAKKKNMEKISSNSSKDDLRRAITMDEMLVLVKKHIHELFKNREQN